MRLGKWLSPVLIASATFIILWFTSPRPSPYDHFVRLADSFRQGRLWVDPCPEYLEHAIINEKCFYVFPPLPAILMLPEVLLFGLNASQRLISLLAATAAAVFYWIGLSQLKPSNRVWLVVLAIFGSTLWYHAAVGSSWYLAQVVAFALLSAAVLRTQKQGVDSIGLLLWSLAGLSRLPVFAAAPYFLFHFIIKHPKKVHLRSVAMWAIPIAAILIYLSYNLARFGTIANIAYTDRVGIHEEPWFEKGLMHPTYIPRHLKTFFLELPSKTENFPWFQPNIFGMSFWFTTPALLGIVLIRPHTKAQIALLVGAASVFLANMLHGSVGPTQFGYRFALDAYPFLFTYLASGFNSWRLPVFKLLIALSVLLNLWGVLVLIFMVE